MWVWRPLAKAGSGRFFLGRRQRTLTRWPVLKNSFLILRTDGLTFVKSGGKPGWRGESECAPERRRPFPCSLRVGVQLQLVCDGGLKLGVQPGIQFVIQNRKTINRRRFDAQDQAAQ